MTSPWLKLAVAVLLVVQGVLGTLSGRFVCVPTGNCGVHDEAAPARAHGCGGHDECRGRAAASVRIDRCADHDHGVVAVTAAHEHEECSCHVHIPVREEQSSTVSPRTRMDGAGELRLALPASVVVAVMWDAPVVERRPAWRAHPPDWAACDQSRALKVTRLLI